MEASDGLPYGPHLVPGHYTSVPPIHSDEKSHTIACNETELRYRVLAKCTFNFGDPLPGSETHLPYFPHQGPSRHSDTVIVVDLGHGVSVDVHQDRDDAYGE